MGTTPGHHRLEAVISPSNKGVIPQHALSHRMDEAPLVKTKVCSDAPSRGDRVDIVARVRRSGGMAKPALGRGLGALLGDSPIAKPPGAAPASTIVPGAE